MSSYCACRHIDLDSLALLNGMFSCKQELQATIVHTGAQAMALPPMAAVTAAACTDRAAMAQVAMALEACTALAVMAVAMGAAWAHPCMGDRTVDPGMAAVVMAAATEVMGAAV